MTPMRIRKYVNCMVLLAESHPFGTFLPILLQRDRLQWESTRGGGGGALSSFFFMKFSLNYRIKP